MLSVQGLSKRYATPRGPRTLFENLSFELPPGDRLAILGRNGQGKSTLIKILGGVLLPTSGQAIWRMRPSWPLGFSGGFQGSLTGIDNVRFIARVYGRPDEEVAAKTEAFAELGEAMSMPIKHYSTGMRARLAFGLSLAIEFDCYLIDEIVAVGDAGFREKCQVELFQKRADRAFVIASHDMAFVKATCRRAIIIDEGRAKLFDDLDLAIEIYDALGAYHQEGAERADRGIPLAPAS